MVTPSLPYDLPMDEDFLFINGMDEEEGNLCTIADHFVGDQKRAALADVHRVHFNEFFISFEMNGKASNDARIGSIVGRLGMKVDDLTRMVLHAQLRCSGFDIGEWRSRLECYFGKMWGLVSGLGTPR
jgi:hypothetical protein